MTSPYSLPLIYDIAFDWRNVPGEVDFLLGEAQKHLGRPVTSALELACGPAYHTREISRRGIWSDGVDLSSEMAEYGRTLVLRENLPARIFQGDMRDFRSDRKYDLVYILMVSFAHLLTNQDILDNLACVSGLLNDRGVYIISTAHPRDFFGESIPSEREETTWSAERNGVTVVTDWGGLESKYDPLTEIDEVTISYTVTENGRTTRFDCPEKLRRLSFQTLQALIQFNSQLSIVNLLGDLDSETPLTNGEDSVRMVVVLQKR